MASSEPTILFASGLSIHRNNSFTRQLTLLQGFIQKIYPCRIVSVGIKPGNKTSIFDQDAIDNIRFDVRVLDTATIDRLKQRYDIRIALLLGYPDQFPFVMDECCLDAVFLWAQFSRLFDARGTPHATAVPLTEKSRAFANINVFERVTSIVPHGVDTEVFMPAADRKLMSREAGAPVAISLGANSIRKRFDLLLSCHRLILKRFPDARLIIKTDAEVKSAGFDLPRMLHNEGIGSTVEIVTDNLTSEALVSLYNRADIYIHTSEWEGFGIPVIEAMACGLPVVTHEVQGPGEIVPYVDRLGVESKEVHDGGTILAHVEPESIANVVATLLHDPAEMADLSKEGLSAVKNTYDIRLVAKRWVELFSFLDID